MKKINFGASMACVSLAQIIDFWPLGMRVAFTARQLNAAHAIRVQYIALDISVAQLNLTFNCWITNRSVPGSDLGQKKD